MENDIFINLKDETNNRKKILKEVNSNLDGYSFKILEYENKIKEYELMEIKYKNLDRETKEKVEMYDKKISILNEEIEKLKEEITKLKKESISKETQNTFVKSLLEILIQEYGIEVIANITEFSEEKIKSLVE